MHSIKNATPISPHSPSALKAFFLASRPKTWIASISPVCIGASMSSSIDWLILALTLLFSLGIQIGTNFANDYFDFLKGADNKFRNGPKRATLEGWISPKSMWHAAQFVLFLSLLIAIPLMMKAGVWSFFLALLCVSFAIFYTGGPKPLGYIGLGELFVFVFFGPVATGGTYFLQTGHLSLGSILASFIPAFFSCALLAVNNLRDEKTDRAVHKKTLAVRFGKTFGSWEFAVCLLFAQLPVFFLFLLGFSSAPLLLLLFLSLGTIPLIRKAFCFRDPLELISVLQNTSLLFFFYTLFFCVLM